MATGKIIQADKIQGLADVPNFLSNPNGLLNTSGWTEGSYTAGSKPTGNFTASSGAGKFSIARTTTNPLGMTGTSLVFTKSSGNQQGRAVETIFPLPLDYRAKVLKLSASYINTSTNATDFAAGSTTTDSDMIFYTAYSTDGGTTYTVAEPSSFKLLSNSKDNSSPYDGTYQTPYNATHLKLIAYVATTSTTAWSIKAVLGVSPSQYVYGAPISDWQSYTPTFNTSFTVGTGGSAASTWLYRRVGDTMEINGGFILGSSGSSMGSGNFSFTLPSGFSINYSKLQSSIANYQTLGLARMINDAGTGTSQGTVVPFNGSTNTFNITLDNSTIGVVSSTGPFTWGAGDGLEVTFRVPILGWSSSVQMSDGYDGRVVAARMSLSTDVTGVSGSAALPFNTIGFDTTGSFNTSTNKYKIPVSGTYRISSHTRYTTLSAQSEAGIQLIVDGVVVDYIGTQTMAASSLGIVSGSTLRQLNAGQEVQIGRYSSNGTYTVTSAYTSFEIERISGSPTISAQETVACRYTNSAGTTIGTGVTSVPFANKSYDTHGAWDGNQFKAPVAGFYRVSVKGLLTAVKTIFRTFILKNGSTYSESLFELSGGATMTQNMSVYDEVYLLAGETISISMQSDSSSGNLQSGTGKVVLTISKM